MSEFFEKLGFDTSEVSFTKTETNTLYYAISEMLDKHEEYLTDKELSLVQDLLDALDNSVKTIKLQEPDD